MLSQAAGTNECMSINWCFRCKSPHECRICLEICSRNDLSLSHLNCVVKDTSPAFWKRNGVTDYRAVSVRSLTQDPLTISTSPVEHLTNGVHRLELINCEAEFKNLLLIPQSVDWWMSRDRTEHAICSSVIRYGLPGGKKWLYSANRSASRLATNSAKQTPRRNWDEKGNWSAAPGRAYLFSISNRL